MMFALVYLRKYTDFSWSMKILDYHLTLASFKGSCVVPIITHSHALDDAAGGFQKGRVCDLQQQIPAGGV